MVGRVKRVVRCPHCLQRQNVDLISIHYPGEPYEYAQCPLCEVISDTDMWVISMKPEPRQLPEAAPHVE